MSYSSFCDRTLPSLAAATFGEFATSVSLAVFYDTSMAAVIDSSTAGCFSRVIAMTPSAIRLACQNPDTLPVMRGPEDCLKWVPFYHRRFEFGLDQRYGDKAREGTLSRQEIDRLIIIHSLTGAIWGRLMGEAWGGDNSKYCVPNALALATAATALKSLQGPPQPAVMR